MRTPLLVDASARERICWRRNCHDPRALSKAKDETARSLAVAARYGRDCAADKGREAARVCRRETGRIANRRRGRVTPLTSGSSGPLVGRIRVPGDKSISHRALMLGALAVGESRISGLLEGEDVLRTATAMRALGATLIREAAPGGGTVWRVAGVGVGGLAEPDDILDLGNAGTGARLLMGLIAGHPITATLTGDASLRRRPMARAAEPLRRMGARIVARDGCRLPLTIVGAVEPMPIEYRLPVPSAQVKSAVLLAGLNAAGATTVIETLATRDHSERMLRHFGATVDVEATETGGRIITLTGQPELHGADLVVPGDPSSAAFPAVAALLLAGSDVTIEGVGINTLRTGLFTTLLEMGGAIEFRNERLTGGEPVADLVVRASRLAGVEVPASRAPSMIDEYPILAVAAAFARGRTTMRGLGELRVKESDRLAAIARGLAACGVSATISGDDLVVEGHDGPPPGGAAIATQLDHRPAMAFLIFGMAARKPVAIDDGAPIATSFPDFVALMNGLGASIARADRE
jgi:3-phosphoshikimate 1-carboxyvinyltransferase